MRVCIKPKVNMTYLQSLSCVDGLHFATRYCFSAMSNNAVHK